ncbi:MAG: DUF4349 domain-containing protein [Haliscomenobacter sp.]|uniref:DUF4349 domain-containing protein n=1 Tax=Haliscomenobacter sp. TaxID=2717303 RepID=UPI0029A40801|nr:DUF4349 domain-containing protein [Haliscomenobacter sp.]MDX2070634.1 DUF4349 domain-containing protein [Haliscomenobacter sp.]
MRTLSLWCGLLLCSILFSTCQSSSGNFENVDAEDSAAPQTEEYNVKFQEPPPPPPPPPGENEVSTPIEPKLIKTGTLEFETSNLEATYQRVRQAAQSNQAFLSNESSSNQYDRIVQHLTIRVPSRNFDNLIKAVSEGVKRFDTKTIEATDVTEEFVDAEARLKTKKQLEQRYQELLKRANKVSEILEIEEQIGALRAEIEAVEGRLRYLNNRVDYSTLDVQFYKKMPSLASNDRNFGRAFLQGWDNFVSLLFGLVANWSTILILVVSGYFLQRYIRRKLKNRTQD